MSEHNVSPIIDHVPSNEELSGISDPGVLPPRGMLEPISPHLIPDLDGEATIGEAHYPTILRNMSRELQFSPEEGRDGLVRDAYSLARHLVDMSINRDSRRAFNLLDDRRRIVRRGVRFRDASVGMSGVSTTGYLKSSNSKGGGTYKELGIKVENTLSGSWVFDDVRTKLESEGVKVEKSDLSLMLLMKLAGHEAGHLVQQGIAMNLRLLSKDAPNESNEDDMLGTFLLTAGETEQATGNLKTDAHIYSERFAEGYGLLALRETAESLGYEESTVAKIEKAVRVNRENIVHPDLIDYVTPDKDLGQVMDEAGVEGNPGELGYTIPLDKAHLTRDLEFAHDSLMDDASRSPAQISISDKAREDKLEETPETSNATEKSGRVRRLIGRVGLGVKHK